MKLKLGIVLNLLFAMVLGAEEVKWEQEFIFKELPSALNPNWIRKGSPETSRIEGEKLVIIPGSEPYVGWFTNGNTGNKKGAIWNGAGTTTIEFRMAVREISSDPDKAGVSIGISDGIKVYRFSFKNRKPMTFRITVSDGVALRYIVDTPDIPPTRSEGKPVEWESRGGITNNSLTIGKFNHNIDGTSEWEFIRWTNEGAFAP